MVRLASCAECPDNCSGIWSSCVAPTALLSVGLSISQAYSVGIGPGATAVSRIPYLVHSTGSDMVIASTVSMALADGTTKADPDHTQVVSVDTTDPGRPSAIQRRPAAW